MTIRPATFVSFAVITIIMVAGGTILAGWWLLQFEPDLSETEVRAQLARLEASARTYYGRLQFYDGLCADIGVPKGSICHDTETSYVIETPVNGGRYLCLDNDGFFDFGRIDPDEGLSCQR